MQHAGTDAALEVLADATTVEDATRGVLDLLCKRLDCAYAALYVVDQAAGLLRWAADRVEAEHAGEYGEACRRLSFPRGAGLPGRVWESAEAQWIEDVLEESAHFARARPAAEAGLPSVVAVPVHGRASLSGVLELYPREARARDDDALQTIRTVARLLGEWLERLSEDTRLAASEALRTAMVNAALDCIVTIDADSRVVDFNPAAERTFGWSRAEAIGEDLAELIIPPELRDAHRQALARLAAGGPPKMLGTRFELEAMRKDGARLPVELTITGLQAPEGPLYVGFVRDITERRRAQAELTRLLERETAERRRAERAEQTARRIAVTLQRSLLPPRLPDVPGLDVAAGFHAGGAREAEVGGDFYDLFATAPGRWSWVIGDVCGKGTDAAALTGLARHTVRAATMQEDDPVAVLEVLNQLLLGEPAGGLLTVVLGTLELEAGAARLRLANAGHPPPMVVRAAGPVEHLHPTGTILGAVESPPLAALETELGPGDVLVVYTDGVVECRRPGGGRLELEGLSEVLEAARGLPAEGIAAGIEAATAPGGRVATDDDVAYLVLRLLG